MKNDLSNFFFLPKPIQTGLANACASVWELRLRIHSPIVAESEKGKFYLSESGLTPFQEKAIVVLQKDIENILLSVSGQALYRISEIMKSGAIYTSNGVRIGVCGKAVKEKDKLISVTDITSLCIRFPFFMAGNAQKLASNLIENSVILSTLILSPPAGGKTTLLRDFAQYFSQTLWKNVFVVDERNELTCGNHLKGVDCYINYSKTYVLPIAMQSFHPDVVICDEIMQAEEYFSLSQVINGGVAVFASAHGNSFQDYFSVFPQGKTTFQRFILLQKGERRAARIYNQNLNLIATVSL